MSPRTAVPAPVGSPDRGVAWHYGDPFAEQVALASGTALVDLSHRGVVRVSGNDRLGWLHDLTTQRVRDMKPGDCALALILDGNGRVEYELHLIEDGGSTWLIIDIDQLESVIKYLDSMRFLLDVRVDDETDRFAVVGSGRAEPAADGSPTWIIPAEFRGELVEQVRNAGKYVPVRPEPLRRSEFLVERERLADVLAAAPTLAGTWAWEALRIAAGVPRVGLDTDNRTIPHEMGWIGSAVHLAKGCYRGQETVARVHNLGRPPRRLTLLHLDGSTGRLPARGDRVTLAGKAVAGEAEAADETADNPVPGAPTTGRAVGQPVGTVGSSAQHHELGPIALAVITKSVPLDAALTISRGDSGAGDGTGCAGEHGASGDRAIHVAATQQPIVVI